MPESQLNILERKPHFPGGGGWQQLTYAGTASSYLEDAAKLTAKDRTLFFLANHSGRHQRESGVETPRWRAATEDREEGPMLQAMPQEGPML